ncbi:hypothetical protein [Chloroflexus sp.]|nr:hypothetical protein [Chloroflexus sp.]
MTIAGATRRRIDYLARSSSTCRVVWSAAAIRAHCPARPQPVG